MHDDLLLPLGTSHPDSCPECDDFLLLAIGPYGAYYRCINAPGCDGSAYANADGTPMGTAEPKAVKEKRALAHSLFKVCITRVQREVVETRLERVIGTRHFSRMDEGQLKTAVREIQRAIKE